MMEKILDADPKPQQEGKNSRWAFRFLIYAVIAAVGSIYGVFTFEPGMHSYEVFERNQLLLKILHWSTLLIAGYFVFQATTMQEDKTGKYRIALYGIPFIIFLDVVALFIEWQP